MRPTDESEQVSYELQSRSGVLRSSPDSENDPEDDPSRDIAAQELKPVDRGRDAWTVLVAAVMFEAVFWGFPMCFGVFQNYYSKMPEFQANSDSIPLIGTVAQGFLYLGAPISAVTTKRFPRYQRHQIWLGWPLCICGLLSASFTTSVNGLIGTQGVLYGLGFVTVTYPIVSMLNEWWVARKGMAFGSLSASSGASAAVIPFALQAMLEKYGHRTTLRACAVAMAVLTAPLLPLFRGRLPASEQAVLARTDWGFLRRPLFWIYAAAILVQGLGFFFPIVFLPSYASSVGVSSFKGALLLALMSIAQVLGQFAFGFLSDKNLSVSLLATICCVVASVASLTFWALGKSMPLLVLFSLVYGFFAFGFGTMRVAMGRAVSDDSSAVFSIFAIFVFLQGAGNILVGPVSAALMSKKVARLESYAVGKYEGIAIMTGSTSLLAALIIVLFHSYQGVSRFKERVHGS